MAGEGFLQALLQIDIGADGEMIGDGLHVMADDHVEQLHIRFVVHEDMVNAIHIAGLLRLQAITEPAFRP